MKIAGIKARLGSWVEVGKGGRMGDIWDSVKNEERKARLRVISRRASRVWLKVTT